MPLLVSSATGANGDRLGAVLDFDGGERFLSKFSNDSCPLWWSRSGDRTR
jgi:hypothetical protein